MSGVEIGHIIRDQNEDNEMQIIYISGKTDYAMELFKSRPLDFLVKPLDNVQVEKAILTAVKLFRLKTKYFSFTFNRQTIRISLSSIMYFENNGKKINLFTSEAQFEFYGNIEKIKNQLPPSEFLEVHKSYIINFNYVKEYTLNSVVMVNGNNLPISRSKKRVFKNG